MFWRIIYLQFVGRINSKQTNQNSENMFQIAHLTGHSASSTPPVHLHPRLAWKGAQGLAVSPLTLRTSSQSFLLDCLNLKDSNSRLSTSSAHQWAFCLYSHQAARQRPYANWNQFIDNASPFLHHQSTTVEHVTRIFMHDYRRAISNRYITTLSQESRLWKL